MSVSELSAYTCVSKYSRHIAKEKRRETWDEAVGRNEDMMRERYPALEGRIRNAYAFVRDKKVLPSMRAMQFGGAPALKHNPRLYNCCSAYCDRLRFFQECFYLLLCGCGTGFSVQDQHIATLPRFSAKRLAGAILPTKTFVIADCIEGWADAEGALLSSYHETPISGFEEYHDCDINFDSSLVRPDGAPLSCGIGRAPGPAPLMLALSLGRNLLNRAIRSGLEKLDSINAYDLTMYFADASVSGGVRRSATCCIFSHWDMKMATCKTGNWLKINPQRARSNNSAALLRSTTTWDEFNLLFQHTKEFGEPGFYWVDDYDILSNPCFEIGLLPYCLVRKDSASGRRLLRSYQGPVIQKEKKVRLSGWQMCVGGDTKLITRDGLSTISECVGRTISVWNGNAWSNTVPFVTGENRKLYRVKFSDGSYLDCTDNHRFLVSVGDGKYQEVETRKLSSSGDRLIMPRANVRYDDDIPDEPFAYEYGFVLGDGTYRGHNRSPVAKVFGNKQSLQLMGTSCGEDRKTLHGIGCRWLTFGQLDRELCGQLKALLGLPSIIFSWNASSIAHFLAGWIDADGSKANRGCRLYGQEAVLRDAQLLFTKIGVNSSINLLAKKGMMTNYGVRTVDLWYLQIPNAVKIPSRRMDMSAGREPTGKGRVQVVRSVTKLPGLHTTYCLTEAKEHCCLFNNVLTKQCNLTTINGRTVESSDDFYERCSIASEIGTFQAGFTDFPYLGPVTEEITKKEALLGVAICGMMHNPDILLNPLVQRTGAAIVLNTNEELARLCGINPCARGTCIKPDGKTSATLMSSPGIIPAHSPRHFLIVQANHNERPYQHFKKVNPEACELSRWSSSGNVDCIRFCIEQPKETVCKIDITAVQMLNTVRLTYENWIQSGKRLDQCAHPSLSHNVSNTIHVKHEEWDDAARTIYEGRQCFAGVSLVADSCDRDYVQAPYTAVYNVTEQIDMYGGGAVACLPFLLDDLADRGFRDLWDACDLALGLWPDNHARTVVQEEWVRRLVAFTEEFFSDNLKRATYALKDAWNWTLWCKLKNCYREVDYSTMVEEFATTNMQAEAACQGGACLTGF